MTNTIPDQLQACAVTLTIPGYPLDIPTTQKLFLKWRTFVKNQGWLCVWRCEIQKRGQLHWHCIMGIDPEIEWLCAESDQYKEKVEQERVRGLVESSWHQCMASMGEIPYKWIGDVSDPSPCDWVSGSCNLMDWKGAERYSCRVDFMSDNGDAWKRYLLDHTTKVKQEQIPENIGRHWGVIGRKGFVEVFPDGVETMTLQEYARLTRAINRMWTPYLRDSAALFGRRRGYTVKRGRIGTTDLFTKSRPSVERLVAWVLSDRKSDVFQSEPSPQKQGARTGEQSEMVFSVFTETDSQTVNSTDPQPSVLR